MSDLTEFSSQTLIRKAVQRHGGMEAFEKVTTIQIRLEKLSGILPVFKGVGRSFTLPKEISVYPSRRRALFQYGEEGIEFDDGTMRCRKGEFENYRLKFAGFKKLRFWSNLDACYFFGYSLVNYFSLPFILQRLPVRSCRVIDGGLSSVEVDFDGLLDTHSRIQKFWFDPSGLLVRHDYTADILGSVFWGAHHSSSYQFESPCPVAERRAVHLRLGDWSTPLCVLRAKFTTVAVKDVSAG